METLPIARPPSPLDKARAGAVALWGSPQVGPVTRCKACERWWVSNTRLLPLSLIIDRHLEDCPGQPSIYRGAR